MFLLVPIIIILACAGGILYIVRRKFQYIKKLEPAQPQSTPELFRSFFPEVVEATKKVDWQEYKEFSYVEIEKMLRRMRLAFLKFERTADAWIKKIRASYEETETPALPQEEAPVVEEPKVSEVQNKEEQEAFDMKKEEQRLIIEIAKDTKNPELYELLGDLYVAMGNLVDAQESYMTAITLDGHRPNVKNKLDSVTAKIGTDIKTE